jgi:hypothetical protein
VGPFSLPRQPRIVGNRADGHTRHRGITTMASTIRDDGELTLPRQGVPLGGLRGPNGSRPPPMQAAVVLRKEKQARKRRRAEEHHASLREGLDGV